MGKKGGKLGRDFISSRCDKALDSVQNADLGSPFGVVEDDLEMAENDARGLGREQFEDAFE